MTVSEAAQALSIGKTQMNRLILTGELGSVKVGRSRRIPASALRQFVERRMADNEGGQFSDGA